MKKIFILFALILSLTMEYSYAKGGKGMKVGASSAAKSTSKPIIYTKSGRISMKNLTDKHKKILNDLAKQGGTYEFKVKGTPIPYLGQAKDFKTRMKQHIANGKLSLDNIHTIKIKTKDKKGMSEDYNKARRNIHEATGINLNDLKSQITNKKLPNIQIPPIKSE